MASWSTKCSWHTELSADSVEWCPVEPYRDVLVCGTYQLEQAKGDDKTIKQKRVGKIFLFIINENTIELSPIQTVEIAGVLDQKWCYHNLHGFPTLAVVTSIGTLQLYRLKSENGTLKLHLWVEHVIGLDLLALSVDWSTNKTPSEEPNIAVSDSSGAVTVLKVVDDGLKEIGKWKTHGFEAWIAAFDYWNTDVFYSGGDDCLFKMYDIRVPEEATKTNRCHDAGVTAVRCHTDIEHQLVTGSYDEVIRTWDARQLKRCVNSIDVGGGVWRIKWRPLPADHQLAVAACMHGGVRALRPLQPPHAAGDYRQHASIVYGADWSHAPHSLLATCSFYDCSLHITEVVV